MSEQRMLLTCPFTVFDSEWIELATAIAVLLKTHDGGKFSNVRLEFEPPNPRTEECDADASAG